ncbi:tRNA adenosine(34) deaminase TadA [Megamonas hypermegale]|uniref:tRNA adenosine(34) deaminase TadA n=1 Tax=Megamonas hypermegale TaxID=158847 RepID=UPI001EF697DF|nr:tRNA adenosine(34) deaminase TadA [Megamonas hypermegale]
MQDKNIIHNDQEGMREALKEAQKAFNIGEIPIGAIICDDKGNIISRGHNLRETTFDATAHAEIVAIKKACQKLKNWRLSDLTLYVTIEPCPMCAGALFMSRIKRLVYGATDWRAGGCESVFNIVNNPYLNHQIETRAGVLEDECSSIVKNFFKQAR